MSPSEPPGPASEQDAERLAQALDRAAESAGATGPAGSGSASVAGPDDALLAAVVTHLRSAQTWAGPPESLRATVLTAALAQRPAPAPPAPVESAATARPASQRVTMLVPRWRRLIWAVPAAAAAAVIFTLLVLGGERLLNSPDNGTSYSIVAGVYAPKASGTVSVGTAPGGFPIVLDAHNLPGAPIGYYYQAWLIAPGQQPVSLGTFHGRRTGQPIKLWSGVDPAGRTFSVRLQSVNAPPTPSGPVVLTSPLGR